MNILNIASNSRGLTLIELVMGVTIFFVLGLIAIPNISNMQHSFRRQNAKEMLDLSLQRARTEAMSNGIRAVVLPTVDSKGFTVGVDYLPYNMPPIEDRMLSIKELPRGITVQFVNPIIFNSQGYIVDSQSSLSRAEFQLAQNGNTYCHATVYPTGLTEYDCPS